MIRGANVFQGYHKDEKNTRATLEPDGFMHTGDIAQIDSAGRILIIDRLKNVLKLSQG
jgi:long-chain acyl-CoA synthetase